MEALRVLPAPHPAVYSSGGFAALSLCGAVAGAGDGSGAHTLSSSGDTWVARVCNTPQDTGLMLVSTLLWFEVFPGV